MGKIKEWLHARTSEMVDDLKELVLIESPTHDKTACDALCAVLAEKFLHLGGRVKLHRQKQAGDHLQVEFAGMKGRKPLLLLGHYDTVYPIGTLPTMPWRESKGLVYGPGVFDMKGGIVQVMFAIRALQAMGPLPRPLTLLLVSDEEGGSETSRPITEKLASRSEAVLVCEPAGRGGALKTARKGVGSFTIRVSGVASHAGLDFEKGQNAILELSHQVQTVAAMTNLARGITLSPGVIRGGTRTNVVPSEAEAEFDLRIATKLDGDLMMRKIRALRAVNKKCKLQVEAGINRPPLERSPAVVALFHQAQKVAKDLGFSVSEIAVGGGSDGNFTAGIGIPTLDGLGAVGDGAHSPRESVVAAEMPRRAALLAGLITSV
ncbi:MAG: M20 family metallopeptidase [Candidatus Korobacteraceae bacterium]